MTLLGTCLQVLFSIVLTLVPAYFLKRDGFKVTIGLCFVALMSGFMAGGLIAAIAICIILSGFFFWLRFVSDGHQHLFWLTLVLVGTWLFLQLAHFPIRIYFEQPTAKIASNVVGIFLGGCLASGCVEMMQKLKSVSKRVPQYYLSD